jgi:periplasmic protein TonB
VVAPPVQFKPPEPVHVPEPQQIAPLPVPEIAKPVESSAPVDVPAAAPEVVVPEPPPPPLVKDRFEVPPPSPAIIVEPVKAAKDPLPSIISLVNQQKKAEKAIPEMKSDVLPPSADPKAATPQKTSAPVDSASTAAAAKKAPVTNQKPLHVDPVVMPANRAPAHSDTMMFRSLEEPASESTVNMKMIVGVLVAILIVAGLAFGVRTLMKNREQSKAAVPAAVQETAAPAVESPAATSATPALTNPDLTTPPVSKPATETAAKSAAPKPESTTAPQEPKPHQPAVIVAGNGSVTKRTEAVEAPQVALNGKADMGALLASGKSATPTLSVKRSVLSPPEVINRVAPKFPEFARRSNPNGDRVVLNATIGADGKVKQVHVVRGQMVFADAAVAAVKQWQYRPAFLNGEAVESTVEVVISFTGR